MPNHSSDDADPGEHRFNPHSAAPALKAAISDLAEQTGRAESEFSGMSLGEAYSLATSAYGEALPEFWRVWQGWQASSIEPPADMGDL